MVALAFTIVLFLQFVTGFALTPLFLFWQLARPFKEHPALIEEVLSVLFWSGASGISLGFMLGNIPQWILIMFVSAFSILLIRDYVFRTLTPVTLSLLLLIFLAVMAFFIPTFTFSLVISYYFFYSFLFFILYALVASQKNYQK